MDRSTDYLGHLDIVPPLNDAEIGFVKASSRWLRFDRPCPWRVCDDGCCLTYDGVDAASAVRWLRSLVADFLKPRARFSRLGDPLFARFGFDHRLDGAIVGRHRETRELFAITVTDNRVRHRVLRPGDEEYAADADEADPAVVVDLASRRT